MPPIICTSNIRCCDSRQRASRTAAKASKMSSSSDSPFSYRSLELDRLRPQLVVGERLELRLEGRDVRSLLLEPLQAPPLAEAQDLLECAADGRGHVLRAYREVTRALIDSSQTGSTLRA